MSEHRKWQHGDELNMSGHIDEHNALYRAWQDSQAELERIGKINDSMCDTIAEIEAALDIRALDEMDGKPIRVPFSDAQIEKMAAAYCESVWSQGAWDALSPSAQKTVLDAIRAALAAGGLEPCAVPEYKPKDVALIPERASDEELANDMLAAAEHFWFTNHTIDMLTPDYRRDAIRIAAAVRARVEAPLLAEIAELKAEVQKMRKWSSETISENNAIDFQCDALRNDLAASQARVAELEAAGGEFLRQSDGMVAALRNELEAAKAERDMERDRANDILKDKQFAEAECTRLSAELAAVTAERGQLLSQVRRYKKDYHAALGEAQELRAELAALRQRSVPVKVRFDVGDDDLDQVYIAARSAHSGPSGWPMSSGVKAVREALAANAVIDVPPGVPSVEELVKAGQAASVDVMEKIGLRASDEYDTAFATAIRDRVLAGVAGEKSSAHLPKLISYDNDELGRMVRHAWVEWAKEQPNPKPSWLLPYDELSEPDKEADRRIGEHLLLEIQKRLALVPKGSTAVFEYVHPTPTPTDKQVEALARVLRSTRRKLFGLEDHNTPPKDNWMEVARAAIAHGLPLRANVTEAEIAELIVRDPVDFDPAQYPELYPKSAPKAAAVMALLRERGVVSKPNAEMQKCIDRKNARIAALKACVKKWKSKASTHSVDPDAWKTEFSAGGIGFRGTDSTVFMRYPHSHGSIESAMFSPADAASASLWLASYATAHGCPVDLRTPVDLGSPGPLITVPKAPIWTGPTRAEVEAKLLELAGRTTHHSMDYDDFRDWLLPQLPDARTAEPIAPADTLEKLAEIGLAAYYAWAPDNCKRKFSDISDASQQDTLAQTVAILRAAKPVVDLGGLSLRTGKSFIHSDDLPSLNSRIRYRVELPETAAAGWELDVTAEELRGHCITSNAEEFLTYLKSRIRPAACKECATWKTTYERDKAVWDDRASRAVRALEGE